MQIDVVAFFYLLLAVAVFIVYAFNKGKGKRPSIAEEVTWEEMTIEQALTEYNPATANAMPALSSVMPPPAPPPPPVVDAQPQVTPPPQEEEQPLPEIDRTLPTLNTPDAYKRRLYSGNPTKQQPFVFNPRDAVLYEIIWKRKF